LHSSVQKPVSPIKQAGAATSQEIFVSGYCQNTFMPFLFSPAHPALRSFFLFWGKCWCIVCFVLLLLVWACPAEARHIKGGWIQYEYSGPGATSGTSIYKITVYLFKNCDLPGPFPSALGIYDASTYVNAITVTGSSYSLQAQALKIDFGPCISSPPKICYQIYTYSTTVTLTNNTNGYLIAVQEANRVDSIRNLVNSASTGITLTATIPGILNGNDYHVNSSPFFKFTDTAVICYSGRFTYQFNATDADGDSLSYSFGNGLNGSSQLSSPPYSSITYAGGYAGTTPLGGNATINPQTGLISGTAPSVIGEYVIAVYVDEWRNGVKINTTKKELQITVAGCTLSGASLQPVYLNCNNYSFSFQNESVASNITNYNWDFGVTSSTKDTSTNPTPTFTYTDTGTYVLKLVVSNSGGCKDSATASVKVYPGFNPSFTVAGSCYQSPFVFTDNSLVKYGNITSRLWDLGDPNNSNDTFSVASLSYQYSKPGTATATISITSSVGCAGSFTKTVTINDKPYIYLPFTDTLICSIDTLPLKAQSTGTFHWSPNYRISDTNAVSPLVYPRDTTTYTLIVRDQGCVDSAKIKVNVLQFIKVSIAADTGICKSDSIVLRPVSDALSYKWRESGTGSSMSSAAVKYPKVAPVTTTTYYVTANLGYCQDSAKIKVNVAPYPVAQLGADTVVCFGKRVQLSARFTGSSFSWSNTATLINTNTLTPIAGPVKTTSYIFTAADTSYCPKPVSDTIVVKVIPPFNIDAGADTVTSVGQALQLAVSGSDPAWKYKWDPSLYLDNGTIYNPVVTIPATATIDSIRYYVTVTTPEGCTASDNIRVMIYRNGPEIYVPSAFTPNGDGKNDVLRPYLVGIANFDFFTVYNRWGQVVFSTTNRSQGWDGTLHGAAQGSGAYVYVTKGEDYTGKTIFRKGTVVLIR